MISLLKESALKAYSWESWDTKLLKDTLLSTEYNLADYFYTVSPLQKKWMNVINFVASEHCARLMVSKLNMSGPYRNCGGIIAPTVCLHNYAPAALKLISSLLYTKELA